MNPVQLQRLIKEAAEHHGAGRLEPAAQLYRRIRQILPNNFDAVQLSGVIAIQQGKPAEAVELLARAMKLDPRSAPCAMRLGVALNSCGRAVEAEKYSRLAIQLDPNFAEGWSNLASCLKSQDRLLEAIECHHRALTLKPNFAMGWYNYGLILSISGVSRKPSARMIAPSLPIPLMRKVTTAALKRSTNRIASPRRSKPTSAF